VIAGAGTIAGDARLRVLIGVYAMLGLVGGSLQVFTVVVAHRLAGLGDPGVGELWAAVGVGGLLGTVAVAGVASRRQLTSVLALGVALWGLGLAAIGVVSGATATFGGLLVVGAANVLADVGLVTLLQRIVPERVLSRVFGVLQSVLALMLVLGALAAPALISAAGTRAALVITGGALPLLVALTWVRLRRIDAPREDAATRAVLLSGMDLFSALPEPTIASLASSLIPVEAPEGRVVIRQGDPADCFYVIADGAVEVTIDGEHVRTQGPGEWFGELALLRKVPRTATVTAKTPVRLYSLDREPFLSAVTGHPASAAVADVLIATRLGSLAAPALPARLTDAEDLPATGAVSD
jgi:hypothetical protein